ncbi:flippase-like domain-containing protein [Neorhizobium galegae]|uniref:lysylphosphatidylglycerol synthase transmembrane domain-containing protein n=1 Tax=Neorhizobium galegae TaxID=399 RepID=UPI0006222222|nr:lysylphosphatidylglycerol synthase transmembrane domain-containing protein [Neorhizobium galegae]MCQ1769426.1 flippase-like domain-containing protein [Neorhizobium galegae]MCQ1849572.1 flippase-like domain-containing protein [Neorhizobium galegae]CDZ42413.1 Putative integral membrane protein [Neorhizobium galegae bv. officinalis]
MRFLKLIGLSAAFALLIAVILRFDPQRIAASLASADSTYISAGLILVQVQIVLSALRWRFTATRLGQHLGVGKAIGDYYLGTLLNQILPGGVAGDAVRAVRNRTHDDGGWKVPAQAVLFERIAGQGVFFVIATFGVMFWPLLGGAAIPEDLRHLLSGFALVAAGLAIMFLLLLRFPPRRVQPLLAALKTALAQVFLRDRAWIVQTLFSLVIVASYIAMFMLASAAVGAPLPALAAITAIPLCLLMMLIPATIAGWGAREAAAAALWPLFGYAASDGVAASILYGILALVGAAPGLAFILAALFSRRNR